MSIPKKRIEKKNKLESYIIIKTRKHKTSKNSEIINNTFSKKRNKKYDSD